MQIFQLRQSEKKKFDEFFIQNKSNGLESKADRLESHLAKPNEKFLRF